MEDDVLVEEFSGLGALDPPLVVADEAALVEARPLGAEEGAAPAARRAQVVHLAEMWDQFRMSIMSKSISC